MLVEIIGFLAAFTSTVSLIPQIIKTFRTKSAEDVSFFMLVNFLVTSLLWLLYGLMIGAAAVWVANAIMTLFSIVMLALKVRFSRALV